MLKNEKIYIEDISSIALVKSDPRPQKRIYYGPNIPKYELIYKISGENYTHFNDETFHMQSGVIAFLPKCRDAKYYIDRISFGDCIDIFFDTNSPMPCNAFSIDVSSNKIVKSLFSKLHYCWTNRGNGYYYRSMALLYEIIAEIQIPDGNYISKSKYDKIKPGIQYLQEPCFDSDIDYYMPAKICKISYTYFKQLFRLKYDISPHTYVTELRLKRAVELLSTDNYSISNIAYICGYNDIFYFSKVFKKRYGVSPIKYKDL